MGVAGIRRTLVRPLRPGEQLDELVRPDPQVDQPNAPIVLVQPKMLADARYPQIEIERPLNIRDPNRNVRESL